MTISKVPPFIMLGLTIKVAMVLYVTLIFIQDPTCDLDLDLKVKSDKELR